ncbi:MAG: exodeoxyribonuclease VII small subunit [Candidatus Dasytiphilus stammeri]
MDENKPISFESSLKHLEEIVHSLEKGDLPLEEALNAFEKGVQLAKLSQKKLQQAEQRMQILMSNDTDSTLLPFTADHHE